MNYWVVEKNIFIFLRTSISGFVKKQNIHIPRYYSHSIVPVGVVIDSTIRGKGYGSKLLREIERYYVDTRYELFTSTRSVDNIRLYEKLGYKIFDEKKITDELVFVYMEKMPV